MAKRIYLTTEKHLKQILQIPEECKIVQILQNHKTDEIEIVLFSKEEVSDEQGKVTYDVVDAREIRPRIL